MVGIFEPLEPGFTAEWLFGNMEEAEKKNEQQRDLGLQTLAGVPIGELFQQARQYLAGGFAQGRADLQRNYQQGINAVGSAGVGAQLGLQRQTGQSIGDARTSMAQRGLYGSSLLGNATSGIRAQSGLASGQIASGVAGQQAGLLAGLGQGLAQSHQAQGSLGANLFTGQAGLSQRNAESQANLRAQYAYQGTDGMADEIIGAAAGGAAGACCWIFLEAYGAPLDPVVRRYRDEHVTPRLKRGYYKLAEVLVPIMRKSRLARWAVRLGMTAPLASYARWHYGEGRVGWVFAPLAAGWLKAFEFLGQDCPFRRESGELV
jgi:hypothetical protein